jgi:hypothetical protein
VYNPVPDKFQPDAHSVDWSEIIVRALDDVKGNILTDVRNVPAEVLDPCPPAFVPDMPENVVKLDPVEIRLYVVLNP